MPELPEVETVRRGLMPAMVGAQIDKVELRRPDIRFPFPDSFAKRLMGRRILDVGRRAKYLLFPLDSGETLIAHLGMSGSFRIENTAVSTPGEFLYERSTTWCSPSITVAPSSTTTRDGSASWIWRRAGRSATTRG
jgi:formamidopyrimidine-DNA glycosylase